MMSFPMLNTSAMNSQTKKTPAKGKKRAKRKHSQITEAKNPEMMTKQASVAIGVPAAAEPVVVDSSRKPVTLNNFSSLHAASPSSKKLDSGLNVKLEELPPSTENKKDVTVIDDLDEQASESTSSSGNDSELAQRIADIKQAVDEVRNEAAVFLKQKERELLQASGDLARSVAAEFDRMTCHISEVQTQASSHADNITRNRNIYEEFRERIAKMSGPNSELSKMQALLGQTQSRS